MSRDMRVLDLDELRGVVGEQPYPLVFATVSGAHLYGFASVDSDVDLRGVHVLPAAELLGLRRGPETLDATFDRAGAEMDLVTHDVVKFARMMLRRNGYVLEQLLSPLVVTSSPGHAELVALAPACLTRHHARHYLGFARGQWELFGRTGRLKPLLYAVRVLATGTHLLRTGQLEASLPALLDLAPAWTPDALAAKAADERLPVERAGLPGVERLQADVERMTRVLEQAQQDSTLPDEASVEPALHDLVLRLRRS